jgi:hypothetical protein
MNQFNCLRKSIGLLVAMTFVGGLTPSAFAVEFTDADTGLKFTTADDGTCAVSGYDENLIQTDLVIPATVTNENVTYTVTSIANEALAYCGGVNTVVIPEGVTAIGTEAFNACFTLTSVKLPTGVKSIGDSAFQSCSVLESVNIPDGITEIGYSTFSSCEALTSISIPESVTSIGESAFFYCVSLASIEIPEGVTTIGYNAFALCTSLTSVTIPSSVTDIEGDSTGGAFYYCTGLKSVTINMNPNGTKIGDSAFNYCDALTTVTFNGGSADDGAVTLGASVFAGSALETIVLNTHILPVATDATFSDWQYENTRLQYPDDMAETIAADAVWGKFVAERKFTDPATGLIFKTALDGETCSVAGYDANLLPAELVIPATVTHDGSEYSVTSIDPWAFVGNLVLTSVDISEGITVIDQGAFFDCESIASVKIPESVTGIEYYAFTLCKALKSVTIPSGVQLLTGYYKSEYDYVGAFYLCSGLEEVTINLNSDWTIVGPATFAECESLKKVTLNCSSVPKYYWSFEDYAFLGCSSLETIVLNTPKLPVVRDTTFDSAHYDNVTIECNDELAEVIKDTDIWKNFMHTSALNRVVGDKASVTVDGMNIVVSGRVGDVSVYNTSGQKVYQGHDSRIALPAPGIYIAIVNNRPLKVAVK